METPNEPGIDNSSVTSPAPRSVPTAHHTAQDPARVVVGDGLHSRGPRIVLNKWLASLAVVVFGGIGTYLLFVSQADTLPTNGKIFYQGSLSINADGTGKGPISSALQPLVGDDWAFSRSGSQVAALQAVVSNGLITSHNVVVADSDGSNQKTILSSVATFDNGSRIAWSPDGQWLAFGVATDPNSTNPGYPTAIAVVHPDGSNYHQIPNVSLSVYDGFGGVSWLSDSQHLVYTDQAGLCIVSLAGDTNNCVALTEPVNGYFFRDPQVSPDGSKVLLTGISSQSASGGQALDVYEVNVDGSQLKNLTNVPNAATATNIEQASDATWSPDGSLIAYGIGVNAPTVAGLYIMAADGTSQHRIDAAQGFAIGWQAKQPTDARPSAYFNGNIYYGNYVLTSDGVGTGYSNIEPLDSLSWTGKQYVNLANFATGGIAVGGLSDPGTQPHQYTLAGTTYIAHTAWSRTPAADGSGQKVLFVDSGSSYNVSTSQLGSLNVTTGASTLYTVSNATGLTNPSLYSQSAQVVGVDWSQDNSAAYYAVYDGAAGSNKAPTLTLCTYTISSKATTCSSNQITLGPVVTSSSSADMSQVVWSPDDGRVAYAYKGSVFVANSDGSAPIQVSAYGYSSSYNTKVVWSADGLSLLYTFNVAGHYQINSVDVASKRTTLFNDLTGDPNTGGEWLLAQPVPLMPADTKAPTVSGLTLNWAQQGAAKSDLVVTLHATDDFSVARVAVYDNGSLVKTVSGSSNSQDFSITVPVGSLGYGQNAISVNVSDFAGNTATATGTVTRAYAFTPVAPARLADTTAGSGQPYAGKTLAAGGTLKIQVAGVGGVPSSGVGAVVVNLTELTATVKGFETIYPTGQARPAGSTVNTLAGKAANSQTTVALGTNGQVTVYNSAGSTNVALDVVGYYSSTGNTYTPLTPARITDTRANSGKPNAGKTVAAKGSLNVQVTGVGGVPTTATAAVVQISAVNIKATGSVNAYAAGSTKPLFTVMNHATAATTREATVQLGTNPAGAITLYNNSSSTIDFVVDVVGYYSSSATGFAYVPLTPQMVVDTRANSGLIDAGKHIVAAGTLAVPLASLSQLPTGVQAIVGGLNAPSSTAASLLTAYPDGITRPTATSLSTASGVITFNELTEGLSSAKQFDVYNSAGTTDVTLNLLGYFY
ncbi:MAG TPA: hypothetical protein VLE99_01400 [Candidatus Saccharimonadales bacterium]|nr:hypothetical protein [Candidatus Saccharimonadales bacterium]